MHPFVRCFALVVVVAASACSSATAPTGDAGPAPSPPGNTTASGKSPCLLLTRADAEATVGEPLSENVERKELGSCHWTTSDFAAGASLTVSSWDAIKKAETSQNEKPVAVSGVGDEAYSNGPDLFFVRHGAEGFLLMLHGPGIEKTDQGLAQYKTLASKVVAKFWRARGRLLTRTQPPQSGTERTALRAVAAATRRAAATRGRAPQVAPW